MDQRVIAHKAQENVLPHWMIGVLNPSAHNVVLLLNSAFDVRMRVLEYFRGSGEVGLLFPVCQLSLGGQLTPGDEDEAGGRDARENALLLLTIREVK